MFGNNFGLGLVLTFTDNATSGINSVVNSLNQLTQVAENASSQFNQMASLGAFSTIATSVGNSFTSMGMKTINTLGDIIGKVNETGQTLMFAENQLGKLYDGTGKTGKDVIADIQDYAKKSIFEFENLIPVVTMLKANGIEAFESIASSTGKSDQMLMDYAADLAAFNPQMRNAYGTGIQAAMGALSEYIAEGNAMSLKRGASLDITSILGEEKGDSIEERSRQVADLMEKLNMVGMTAQLAETPMVKLSNLGDTLFQFVGKIANSGVYDAFNEIIDVISEFVSTIKEEELDYLAKIIADSLASLLTPVKKLAKGVVKLADAFKNLLEENPMIAKFVIQGTALAGVFLVISGVALKVAGAIGFLTIGLNSFGNSFKAITTTLTSGMRSILASMLPLTLAIGAFAFIWKNDLGGVKTSVTEGINSLVDSFHRADEMVNLDVVSMHEAIKSLDRSDFFDNLTYGLMQLKVLFKGVAEAWDDYTLSEDTFEKARELGILPLIEAILDFKYRFDAFVKGFKEGFATVVTVFKNAIGSILSLVKGTAIEDALEGLTTFFKALTDNDADTWEKVGKAIGKFVPILITLMGTIKLLKKIIKPISRGGGIISSILGKKKGGSGGGSSDSLLDHPGKVAKNMASLAIIIGATGGLIVALGAISKIPHFNDFLTSGADVMSKLASTMLSVAIVAGVMSALVVALDMFNVNPKSAALGLANIAILLVGLEAIVIAMGALSSIPHFSDFLSNGAKNLSLLGEALSNFVSVKTIAMMGVIALLGFVPIPAVVAGIANLAIIIAGLTAIVSAYGALSKIEGFNDFIKKGGETLANVFEQVGLALGSLVGGFAEGISDKLPQIGTNLSEFGENVRPFFENLVDVQLEKVGEFAKALGEFVLEIGAAEFLSFFSGGVDLVSIGTQLADFGKEAKPFFEEVAQYPQAGIDKAPSVFASLGGIGDYDFKTGGLAQFFTGKTNLTTIGEQLASFASNGATFFNEVATYSQSGIDKAPSVFQALKGIGDYDFKTGGLAQLIGGKTSLGKIGEQLAEFAEKSGTFFTEMAKVQNIGKISEVLKPVEELARVSYNVEIKSFGKQLVSFGKNFTKFTESLSSSKDNTSIPTLITKLNSLGTTVSTVSTKITSSFGTMSTKVTTSVSTIKSEITSLASTLKNTTFSIPQTNIKLPHFKSSGKFDMEKGDVPKYSVSWYAKGGVFNSPSIIGVGESGTEAVMPLENNTGWIDVLANQLVTKLQGLSIEATAPKDNSLVPIANKNSNLYDTSSNTPSIESSGGGSNTYDSHNTSQNVTFAEGSIQLNVQNASPQEAEKLAKYIMNYIKRQTELQAMANYG